MVTATLLPLRLLFLMPGPVMMVCIGAWDNNLILTTSV
jgi:hypothetical protein